MDNIKILRLKLEKLLEYELKSLELLKAEYEKYRKGKLYISKINNRYYFVEHAEGIRKGLNKNTDRIYELARIKYLKSAIEGEKKICKSLKELLDAGCDEADTANRKILENFHMLDSRRVECSEAELEWLEEGYFSNTYKPEDLRYFTEKGVKMRSKSERTIGNKLEEWNIAYRYEDMLLAAGEVYYPDFTIRKKSGEIVIWEHFGLIDNSEYYRHSQAKIDRYRKIGIKQYRNLICTYEDDLEEMSNIDEIILRFLID